MMTCEQVREAIHRYLDGELQNLQVTGFESHLLDCADCREEHRRWREVVNAVRGAQAYPASAKSAGRARELLAGAERCQRQRYLAQIAALFVLLLGGVALWLTGWLGRESESFRVYAAESHVRYARGLLNLDIRVNDPAALSRWLEQNLPFHLRLPAYPIEASGGNAYEVVGAQLLHHRQDDVAFLSYTMHGQPVSLLVTSAPGREPSGGQIYRSGELDFHFYSVDGLKLISWVDKGLSYVIVSNIEAEGAESCVVCHGQGAERRKFEGLRPAN